MSISILLAAISWWAVEPMSNARYLPDAAPKGGVLGGAVEVLAAQGEFESGSFVLSSDADVASATLVWGDLVSKDGARIPAAKMDAKIVLCWYQQGTAWYGFNSDMTRRMLTPELLVHDEAILKVDHATQDNYVRCDHKDGTTDWYWTTYLPLDCNINRGYYSFRSEWVHDAKTLQPFALAAGKYKQFWLTVGVPKGAKPGLYRGEVKVKGEGCKVKGERTASVQQQEKTASVQQQEKTASVQQQEKTASVQQQEGVAVPIVVRVLPFELPKPGTFRDPSRRFYAAMYMGPECGVTKSDDVARLYAEHNLTSPFLDVPSTDAEAKRLYDTLERFGFDTSVLFCNLPSSFYTMSNPAQPDDADWARYANFRRELSNAVQRVNARFGTKAKAYSYGYDEAGAAKVIAERAAWRDVHQSGGRTIVATRMRDYILYSLDAACIPEQPAPMRKQWCDTLHESNPDMLVGWYSDPHSGPENPDLARRQYGWQSWRNNYDMVCQYTMFVRGWSEFNRPYEPELRSLSMCYAGDRQMLATLQFEGFREAIDDIRYATLLKTLALEAAKAADADTMYLGRAALSWLAQVPFETYSLNALRYETVDKILKLMGKVKSKK